MRLFFLRHPRHRLQLTGGLLGLSVLLSGCNPPSTDGSGKPAKPASSKSDAESTRVVKKSLESASSGQSGSAGSTDRQTPPASTQIVKKSFVSGNGQTLTQFGSGAQNQRKTNLTKAVLDYAREAQAINPCVLLWVIDQTPSATRLRDQVVAEMKTSLSDTTHSTNPEMLVVGYSATGPRFFTEQPVDRSEDLVAALDELVSVEEEQENTFAALHQTIDKFGELGQSSRKTVLLVLVTDEAGDDAGESWSGQNIVDGLIDRLKKLSIPMFTIGYAAPFGRLTDQVQGRDKEIDYGPETARRERINLGMWNGSTAIFRFDSGFGPWNLERVCRASGGRFLADRPAGNSMRLASNMNSNWPAVTARQFPDSALSAYQPFYGPEADYLADIETNPAKRALYQASQLPFTEVLKIQTYEFRQSDEAAMSREINMIQRTPAVILPGLERLYDVLKAGEAGRDALNTNRWRASFDLAYGRVIANYVRVVGLNAMLAELKGGKSFSDPANNTWILQPSEEMTTGSSNQKLADKARLYLQRVVDQHPRTPWAVIAEEELESPLGWKWLETQR